MKFFLLQTEVRTVGGTKGCRLQNGDTDDAMGKKETTDRGEGKEKELSSLEDRAVSFFRKLAASLREMRRWSLPAPKLERC